MKRRIVQIAVAPEGLNTNRILYALSDDGTLWMLNDPWYTEKTKAWEQMAPLPDADGEA